MDKKDIEKLLILEVWFDTREGKLLAILIAELEKMLKDKQSSGK